ncbi:MerR family transcriptional regulator [Cohnella mopanensis]|uniref:MerR family transcriptional regulator n=1 Tax=Cohnella mopanensis TaxID=2911966 RepID=UPI001EF920E7|nr:MerR family transcriptional regulator [Cohnella mopanensis]
MNTMKTKDAAVLLDISQTTVKRWASQFPSDFHKDHLGHYVFTGPQINLLLYIKDRIEQGTTLDQIKLPVSPKVDLLGKTDILPMPRDEKEWMVRINEVERSLQQKADEVVSAQVLQHRAELDELRQMVAQLAASVETLQEKGVKSVTPREEFWSTMPTIAAATPPKKRGFFRTFF